MQLEAANKSMILIHESICDLQLMSNQVWHIIVYYCSLSITTNDVLYG